MTQLTITEHTFNSDRHKTFYRAAGPVDGPLIIFTHGWPEQSLSWRHQLPFFAAMGFRAVAPDMRGYGYSSIYHNHSDYCQQEIVFDMLELLESLQAQKAIWVGHDWGAPVAWNIARHHPEKCVGVASLCIPYATLEQGLDFMISLVNRDVYPIDEFPAGQWEYMRFYEENFADATKPMDANPRNMLQAMFRKGSADGMGTPSGTAMVRRDGGWFGGLDEAPVVPRDDDVISEAELDIFSQALSRNGLFGPNSWYMNHEANAKYHQRPNNSDHLAMPALFLAGHFDYTCESITSRLTEPMRQKCKNLTEATIDSGHWMAQEKPQAVNRELARWIFNQNLVGQES